MPPARVVIEFFHLLVRLLVIPSIVVESVDRSHETGSVPAACAMDIEWLIAWVFDYFQELIDHLWFRIVLIAHGDVEISHLRSFSGRFRERHRVVSQVDDCLNT